MKKKKEKEGLTCKCEGKGVEKKGTGCTGLCNAGVEITNYTEFYEEIKTQTTTENEIRSLCVAKRSRWGGG
jgi:hypothetical protein